MKRLIKNIVILFCLFFSINSQAGIYGKVLDKVSKEPLQGCIVVAKDINGKVINHTITDEEGLFNLDNRSEEASTVTVSMMTYANQVVLLEGASFPLTIFMEEQPFVLNEVSIKAEPIRAQGDTIAYLVSSFAQTNDQTIGEVLKRMPGIQVENSGKIKYQGVDINKFYIEGQDLLGDKYGVATKGIAYDDIGAVEVMERHQPMQVLQGFSISDQAAINLKLKENKKSAWLVHGSIGGGYAQSPKSGLWNGDLFVLTAMPKSQTLLSLKSNNNGYDLSEEQTEFNALPRGTEIENYFGLTLLSPPSLKPERTTFNTSTMASINELLKINSRTDLKVQIDYLNNRLVSKSRTITRYFLEGDDKEIIEVRDDHAKENMLRANVTIEANQPTYYLQNNTKAQFDWDKIELQTAGTFNNNQSARLPNYYANNSLKVIKRFGDRHLVTFSSINEWESRPSMLTINQGSETYGQRIDNQAFFTDERAIYNFHIGQFMIGLDAGFQGLFRSLSGKQMDSDDNQPYNKTNLYTLQASPKVEWRYKRIQLGLSLPVSYRHYDFRSLMEDKDLLTYAPILFLNWQPSSSLRMNIRGGSGSSPLSLSNIYQGVVMTNYRSFSYGYEELLMTKRQQVSARLSYRNPSKGLFSNLMVMHHWINNPYRMEQKFEGNYLYHSYERGDSRSRIFNSIGSVNKSLDFMRGGIGINAMYTRSTRDIISQHRVVPFDLNLITFGSMLNGNVSRRFFFLYEFELTRSWLNIPRRETSTLNNQTHSLKLVYTPINPLSLELKGEYYHNEISKDMVKDLTMLDANITFRVNKNIELKASVTNILNIDEYAYTNYGLLSAYSFNRQLRGREVLLTLRVK
ncbi:carboxypeptidase-like regulatory domain-containing protein [Porphyromonadaceae bacterium W3.11]|nr:carboxypeptidase-like regulatory domain-containing protein [Porphyromonadaceae bacterium W3.11]